MKSTGSDMYDENIHYPRLIILTKAGWRSVVITVNNANLWYYVFQILAAYPNKCNVDYSSFYHWNKICFVWVVWVKIFSSADWRDTWAYLTWPCDLDFSQFHPFVQNHKKDFCKLGSFTKWDPNFRITTLVFLIPYHLSLKTRMSYTINNVFTIK